MNSPRPRLAALGVLGVLGLAAAQLPPAPPAPPLPPAAPAPPPPEIDPDVHMHQSRERHLKDLAPTGIHHEQGLWLYGDYKRLPEAKSPLECAKACEADQGCLHWNFQVVHHICDLKSESSGHNEDAADWISGNAARYRPPGSTAARADL
mmetsp:Transcript_4970/g.15143  ORF Transcript_4970/g.15143 Transcript_4970/m.15143 type:complete len:150 (-) Transcript_4970:272-721(-)